MTSETKTFIELEDVLAFQFECTTCGATCTRKLSDFHRIPLSCSNCGTDWFEMSDSSTKRILENLASALKASRLAVKDRPFRFKVEVARAPGPERT